jgi:putative membrane protein
MIRKGLVAGLAVASALTIAATPFVASARNLPPSESGITAWLTVEPLDDATIVAIFDAANTADIETGQLAVERGHAKEVRDFGAMLVRDHEAVRKSGRDLAAKLGVTPTPPKDDAGARAHAEALAKLKTLDGAAFDTAFLHHEAAFHKGVIDAVTSTLLPAIQNAELKALVERVAPAFQAHMRVAQDLERQLRGGSGR